MRFLADENFPGAAVTALLADGHDVLWVRSAAPGTDDPEIIRWAARDRRVLLTFDKDFGELAAVKRLPMVYGVVLFRIPGAALPTTARRLAEIIESRSDWAGHFSVVEPGRVRMRPLRTGRSRRS